jgi:hypothetical protein
LSALFKIDAAAPSSAEQFALIQITSYKLYWFPCRGYLSSPFHLLTGCLDRGAALCFKPAD